MPSAAAAAAVKSPNQFDPLSSSGALPESGASAGVTKSTHFRGSGVICSDSCLSLVCVLCVFRDDFTLCILLFSSQFFHAFLTVLNYSIHSAELRSAPELGQPQGSHCRPHADVLFIGTRPQFGGHSLFDLCPAASSYRRVGIGPRRTIVSLDHFHHRSLTITQLHC